jgi:tyrosyl-tRNA synthetase
METSMSLIEEFKWRGLIHDMTPGVEEQLSKGMTVGYMGIDPTSDSLHVGHLTSLMMMVHFQRAGHKPIIVVGGATASIGDPSGKSEERNLLPKDVIVKNASGIYVQLMKLGFEFTKPNGARIWNNNSWFSGMGLLTFLRDIGKHFNVNTMLAKDSVQKRMEHGISLTEFMYQAMQAYDFYSLNADQYINCKIQFGGSDQWGNITAGIDLIRRMTGNEAFAITCPLLTKADGTKFGKTEQGTVWLDPNKTSPFAFMQFWLNTSDDEAEKLIKIFSLATIEQTEALIAEHWKKPQDRLLQKTLAQELTVMVHSREAFEQAANTADILFGNDANALKTLPLENLNSIVKDIPGGEAKRDAIGSNVIDFLSSCGAFDSKGEVRRTIQNNGLSLNKVRISDPALTISKEHLLHDSFILSQVGKKKFFLIKVV